MLKKNSLTTTDSWKTLQQLASSFKAFDLKKAFYENPQRDILYSRSWNNLFVDYSKNLFSDQVYQNLLNLAKELDLKHNIDACFKGAKINETEGRAVLHTAFRTKKAEGLSNEEQQEVDHLKIRMQQLCNCIASGTLLGYSGKPIQSIVSIGIGGSYLGIKLLSEALWHKAQKDIKLYFVANVDAESTQNTLKQVDPETTIFINVSKTLDTLETMTNFEFIKTWFLNKAPVTAFQQHFYAVTANTTKAKDLGFHEDHCFKMWDWMGGRFSILGPVGLPIALQIGWDNFSQVLQGAHDMDRHFKETAYEANIPVLLSLIDFWHTTCCHIRATAVIPYAHALQNLPEYLQQLHMESNGKSVDWHGHTIDYHTQPILFGHVGTNVQHSLFQLFHQGTDRLSLELIGVVNNHANNVEYQSLMNSNLMAQSKALMEGKTIEQVTKELKQQGLSEDEITKLAPHKIVKGNKPTTILFMDQLTPYNMGALIALSEHRAFVKGLLWNIYSFDQWGVALGKECQKEVLDTFYHKRQPDGIFTALSEYIYAKI